MSALENNKMIAEFMGLKPRMESPDVYTYSDMPWIFIREDNPENVMAGIAKYVKYNSSWDWLMPVVEKIENFTDENNCAIYNFKQEQCFVEIVENHNSNTIVELDGDSKMDATYKAVTNFIKWYNKKH